MSEYKSLDKTFIYKHLDAANNIGDKITAALLKGTVVSKSNLEEAFLIINKNFKYPLKNKVLEAVENKQVVLVYAPQDVKIPTSIPFVLTKNANGSPSAVVFVDTYGKMDADSKNINIDAKKLYCMMECALMALIYYRHHNELSKRSVIISSGAGIYAGMFTRVLNRKYALNVDKNRMQKVMFLAGKFYMINVLGMDDNETTYNYALRNVANANPYAIKELNDMFHVNNFADLSTFVQALAKPEYGLGLNDLTVRTYLESYITMFDPSALLALEWFPNFIYTVMSVVNVAYINNQFSLEDIVEKDGAKLYMDLSNFMR